MNELFRRLKQRKLVQWTLAYVAAAFALLQGIDIVAQRFGWPEQTMRFVIIALSVGLFVTLVVAWYHGERGAQRVTGTELLFSRSCWQLAADCSGGLSVLRERRRSSLVRRGSRRNPNQSPTTSPSRCWRSPISATTRAANIFPTASARSC